MELALILALLAIELLILVPTDSPTGFASVQAACANPITTCCDISAAGSFTLNQNIAEVGNCINITKSNVNLNCNGFRILYATGIASGPGINVSDSDLTIAMENVTIKNCIIQAGSNSSSMQYGLWLNRLQQSEISNSLTSS